MASQSSSSRESCLNSVDRIGILWFRRDSKTPGDPEAHSISLTRYRRTGATSHMTRTNYLFIDCENIPTVDLAGIAGKPVQVFLILGKNTTKLPLPLVKQVQQHATIVHLVESGCQGRNALDLVLASKMGETRHADPHGYFHIISKDKDFDALITHYRAGGALAARHDSLADVPVLMDKTARLEFVTKQLKAKATGRPATRARLESQIQAWFGKTLTDAELAQTIDGLLEREAIEFTNTNRVTYRL